MSGTSYRLGVKISSLTFHIKTALIFPREVMKIGRIINKPSYYPELERKSRREMWLDNFKWLVKNKELNSFYTSYGLDIKGLHRPEDFIPHHEFCRARNAGNQRIKYSVTGHYNYIVLLRDKYAFSSYLSSTIGEQYVVKNVALLRKGKAFLTDKKSWDSPEKLLLDGSKLIYKKIDGECAEGVMLVRVDGNTVIAGDSEYSKADFVKYIADKNLIVQNIVVQHEALRAFKTRSVNTIRVVTIQGKSGEVNIFAAFLRLSVSPESFVDNRAKGGLAIGVDLDTGKLMKYGLPHDSFGLKIEEHPLSHIRFEGYQLPYWKETVELVCKAHKQFYELQSIGWDVALTENGPVLLEGNDDWEIGGPQDTYGGLKSRWNELVNR